MAKRLRVVGREPGEADELYTVAPAEFIRMRDGLARKLRAAGKSMEATAVQGLRKPTIGIWALNSAARKTPAHVRAFVEALERVKRAQLRQPDDLGAASASMRSSLALIVAGARDAVQAAGTAWSPDLLRRVSDTALGAAAEEASRHDLLRDGSPRR